MASEKERKTGWWLARAVIILLTAAAIISVNAWLTKTVTLTCDGRQWEVNTRAQTVGQLVREQQITLGELDVVEPALSAPLKDGLHIQVHRSFSVKLVNGDQAKVYQVRPGSDVAWLLSHAQVALGPADVVEPGPESPLAPGTTVRITRVSQKTIREERPIPFAVVRRGDPDMFRGIEKVIQKGREGKEVRIYRVTYHNGKEVKRELVDTSVAQNPTNQIVAYGTLQVASRGGTRFTFDRVIDVISTAYSPATGIYTCTGARARRGTIAVDPRLIPLGTRLYVEGYGFGVAQDVGSAIQGARIDVFFESEAQAQAWGIRRVRVYILR